MFCKKNFVSLIIFEFFLWFCWFSKTLWKKNKNFEAFAQVLFFWSFLNFFYDFVDLEKISKNQKFWVFLHKKNSLFDHFWIFLMILKKSQTSKLLRFFAKNLFSWFLIFSYDFVDFQNISKTQQFREFLQKIFCFLIIFEFFLWFCWFSKNLKNPKLWGFFCKFFF